MKSCNYKNTFDTKILCSLIRVPFFILKNNSIIPAPQCLYCMQREAVPGSVFVVEDALPVLQVLEDGAHKGGPVRVIECPVASPETL
jgi:hypothetical protein